jgi:hypothetical protein
MRVEGCKKGGLGQYEHCKLKAGGGPCLDAQGRCCLYPGRVADPEMAVCMEDSVPYSACDKARMRV